MKSLTQREGRSGVLSYGLYWNYRKRFDKMDMKSEAFVHWNQWLRVCSKFNHRKMESIINGHVFNMPFRLGAIGVIQYKKKIRFNEDGSLKKKGLIPDWNKSRILWNKMYPGHTTEELKNIHHKPLVYMTNEHTDGRIFKFHWKKKYCNIKNISAYEFVISRQYKGKLAERIFHNPNVQFCEKF